MTDAKCPWCGAEEVDRCSDGSRYYVCGTHNEPDRQVVNGVFVETPDWERGEHCKTRAELAQHKQRLMDQSARLAAAESELRRLRQVIEAAAAYRVDNVDGRLKFVDDGGVVCCLVPLETLEATC